MNASADGLRYRALWLATGWALVALLVVLSLMPSPPKPLQFHWSDKLEHALAYGLLMGWFMQIHGERAWVRIALALMALGIALEFLQATTATRTFDLVDMVADGAGILLVWRLLRPPYTELLSRLERRLARQ